jgi:hypothetical protein
VVSITNRIRSSADGEGVGVIRSRRLAAALLAAYVLVVGFIVFWPTAEIATDSIVGIWAVLHDLGAPGWIGPRKVEFATNVMLFVPLSFLGSTFKPRWGWGQWLMVGLAGTLTIELSQMFFLPGRYPRISDVVSNTLGALLGYLLVILARRVRQRLSPRWG